MLLLELNPSQAIKARRQQQVNSCVPNIIDTVNQCDSGQAEADSSGWGGGQSNLDYLKDYCPSQPHPARCLLNTTWLKARALSLTGTNEGQFKRVQMIQALLPPVQTQATAASLYQAGGEQSWAGARRSAPRSPAPGSWQVQQFITNPEIIESDNWQRHK